LLNSVRRNLTNEKLFVISCCYFHFYERFFTLFSVVVCGEAGLLADVLVFHGFNLP